MQRGSIYNLHLEQPIIIPKLQQKVVFVCYLEIGLLILKLPDSWLAGNNRVTFQCDYHFKFLGRVFIIANVSDSFWLVTLQDFLTFDNVLIYVNVTMLNVIF